MSKLKRLFQNSLKLDLDEIVFEIYQDKEVQEFILDLNRKDQLFERGIDSLGKELDGYSPNTETRLNADRANLFRYKGSVKKKIAGEPAFLFDEGEFYESFKLVVKKGFAVIEASYSGRDRPL